jgi:hypothetical protein
MGKDSKQLAAGRKFQELIADSSKLKGKTQGDLGS